MGHDCFDVNDVIVVVGRGDDGSARGIFCAIEDGVNVGQVLARARSLGFPSLTGPLKASQ